MSYKIVTKVIVNRLKPILSVMISESQSAFVVGRSISNNIIITHECLHFFEVEEKRFGGILLPSR